MQFLGINRSTTLRVHQVVIAVATSVAVYYFSSSGILGRTLQTDADQAGNARGRAVDLCLKADEVIDREREALVLDRAARNERVTNDDLRSIRLFARELYIQSLELWAASGDFEREALALERIDGVSLGLHDEPMQVWARERILGVWIRAGDVRKQLVAMDLLANQYWGARDFEKAAETFERAIAVAQSAGMQKKQWWALLRAQDFYKDRRDTIGVARCEAAIAALPMESRVLDRPQREHRPLPIPVLWLDIPSCPMVAALRDVNGGQRSAVLKNRSPEEVITIIVGCVTADAGRIRVGESLVPWNIYDSSLQPGSFADGVFEDLDGPATDWTDVKRGCAGGARIAVIEVRFEDGKRWTAEGHAWPG